MKTTTIIAHRNEFTLIRKCEHGGSPTILGATTWMEGLSGPTFIEGGKERALEALKEKQKLGFMPSFA
jgi:hypothetical protein